jgi:hypothetical protein
MKTVTKFETSDGSEFDSFDKATRHAEARYGEALSKLAHRLVQCEKYTSMQAYLDANLHEFIRLQALKADITLEQSGDDE